MDISHAVGRLALANDHGFLIDMRVNAMATHTIVVSRGCDSEHRKDAVKIPADITSRGEA